MNYYVFNHVELTQSPVSGLAMLNPLWCHMKRKLSNETVLIFGRKGSAKIQVGDEIYDVKPDRMLLMPARVLHKGTEQIKKSASYFWVHFYECEEKRNEIRYFLPQKMTDAESEKFLSEPDEFYEVAEKSIVLPQYMDVQNSAVYTNLFNEILMEQKSPSFSPLVKNILVQRLLLEFASEFRDSVSALSVSEKSAGEDLTKKILAILEDELCNPDASVKYFASILGVNADYLGRCFKGVMKISVGQYIQRRRVELSCSRLRETNASVDEVSLQCGFGSRRQFYEEFKKITGKTPAQYRNESAYVGINAL